MRLKYPLIILTVLCALITGGSFYMLDYSLRPEALQTRSRDMEGSFDQLFQTYPYLQAWVDSLQEAGALHDLYIENDEGLRLHALCIPAPQETARTAVVVHGYTDNSIRMLMIGYLYNKILGFNVLLPDLHGHGLSEGNEVQMGWKDRLDVLLWMERAEELFARNGETQQQGDSLRILPARGVRMVVHGISMGAATTMMVAGEVQHGFHQLPYVKCFVEDCGYTSVWDEFAGELKAQFHLPSFPLMHTTSLLCRLKYDWDFREASALKQVSQCTLPMLFIHGDADTFVPTWMVYPLYEAKPGPKELWIAPGTDHAHAYRDHTEAYAARVKAFVEKYIQPE